MEVSVAMTARNASRYLRAALDALAQQTRPPAELVAHDDGSEDSTLALLEGFAAEAPFEVRIVRSPASRGYDAAFTRTVTHCRGDVIAIGDADDVWLPRKLEVCAAALERSEAPLAMHSMRVVDAELRDLGTCWPPIKRPCLVPRLGLSGLHLDAPGTAMVFRRELLGAADFGRRPSSRYGHDRMVVDEWLFFLAGVLGPIQLIAEPLMLYRRHGSNLSEWGAREQRRSFEPALDDYRAAAEQCSAYAGYLEGTTSADPGTAELVAAGAGHYRRAAEIWRLRSALYRTPVRRGRANVVRRLLAGGAYGPREGGGLGRAALFKDIVGGVAIGTAASRALD